MLKAEKGVRIESEFELHEDTAEVCFVLSGRLVLTVGEQEVTVMEGMAARFNALHEHRFDVVEDTEFLLIHHKIGLKGIFLGFPNCNVSLLA
ncbi:MAG: cupin domain-containing protein [Desulfobacterales bacterium]